MEKSKVCTPKIINYFVECGNLNYEYNCEKCDENSCEHWIEFNECDNTNNM